jgi:hypothetical protein
MQEDFEGAFPATGWQLAGNSEDVQWGKRDCRAHGGSYSAWSHGGGAVGAVTACGTAYPDQLESYLIYGPFSLEGATAAEVQLAYWAETQPDVDTMLILLSTDADQWAGWSLSGSSQGWQVQTLDLATADVPGGVVGKPEVWLALGLESDESLGFEGVFFDDVTLRAAGGSPPTTPPPATTTSIPTPSETPVPGEWTTLVSEDFEGDFPSAGWRIESADPTIHWGKRDCHSVSGEYSAWAHGGGTVGSVFPCGTNYPDELETWLIYGPMSFSDVTAAELEFSVLAAIEQNGDPFSFMVSVDAETYYGWVLNRGIVGWYTDTFDLSEAEVPGGVAGRPEVWLAFIFESNTGIAYEGIFLDDVELRAKMRTPRPTPDPSDLHFINLPYCRR